jgi:opacity protein-like surface antigen
MKIKSKNVLLKRWVGSFLLFLFVFGPVPFASAEKGDLSTELMLGFGFGPDDSSFPYDTSFGPGVGAGYEIADGVQLRVDISYFQWEASGTVSDPLFAPSTRSAKLRNIPIFAGGRFFAPLNNNIHLFAELGVSANFLELKETDPVLGTVSQTETKLGLIPGLGIEFRLSPNIGLGANVRYNLIAKGVGDFKEAGTSFLSAAGLVTYYIK